MKGFIEREAATRLLGWLGTIAVGAAFPYAMAVALDADIGSTAASPAKPVEQNAAIEEIIVTARKQQERLQDVPISMTAYTAKDIQRYQTQSLSDVAALTPQLVIGSSTNPTGTIFLRGIGASDNSPSIDQAVSINVDGVQISQAQIVRLAQLDLNQIEILKGPQALFFGKDSPAGVISMNSADPGSTFESKIRTGYEIYNQQEFIEGVVSGPLNDVVGARLDVYASHQKGWFRNIVPAEPGVTQPQTTTYPDQNQYFGRLTLTFTPSDVFDSKLKINAGRLNQKAGPNGGGELFSCPTGVPQAAFGTPQPAFCSLGKNLTVGATSPEAAALEPHFGDGQPFLSSAQELASLTANWHPAKELTVTSVTGYYKDAEDESNNFSLSAIAVLPAFSYIDITQWTEELRAKTSLPGPFNFLLGGFYQLLTLKDADGVIFGVPLAPEPTLYENFYGKEITHSVSGFGQVIYDFAPLWELTAGGRYTSENKTYNEIRYPSALNGFTPAGPLPLTVPSLHFTNLSPEATLSFKPNTDLTLYGAYRQGFVAGGFNIVSFLAPNSDNSYRPEVAKGGEVGVKGLAFDQQLRFDVDVYHYKYSDLQLSAFDPVTLSLPVLNAGAATIYGIETSLVFAPTAFPALSFRGSAAYNHNRYDTFNSGCYSGQTIAQGCNLNFAGGNYNSTSLAGAPLSHAPTWTAAIGASYEAPINGELGVTTSIDATYSSPFYTTATEDPRALQSAFWKTDLSIALHSANRGWEVALIGKNLTNKLTLAESYETPFTGGGFGKVGPILESDMDGLPNPPRTVLIQFTLTNALFHN